MANQPSHLQIFFTRSTYIRKEHISGQQAPQGPHDLMLTVHKGDVKSIRIDVAQDLIVAKTGIRADVVQNKAEMDAIREEAAQDKAKWDEVHAAERKQKKAA